MALGQEQAGARWRDRVRNAWGNLRECLSLRAAKLPAANPENGKNSLAMRPDVTPMDTREVTLSEMVRGFDTFNLGLSSGTDVAGGPNFPPTENASGTDGTRGEPSNTPSANTRPGRSLPPEDSFERFLVDLRTELRVALSHPGIEAASPVESEMPPPVDVPDSDGKDEFNSTTTDSDIPPPLSNNPPNATFPFPPTSVSAGSPGEVPHVTAPGTTSRTEHRPGGGINWWRQYCFPPISAQVPDISALNNTKSVPPATPYPDPLQGGLAAAPEEPAHTSAPGTERRPNVLIPVIIVGLQEQWTGEGEDTLGGDKIKVDGALGDDAEFPGFPNLRRGASRETPSGVGPGSRAFLMHVIGGELGSVCLNAQSFHFSQDTIHRDHHI